MKSSGRGRLRNELGCSTSAAARRGLLEWAKVLQFMPPERKRESGVTIRVVSDTHLGRALFLNGLAQRCQLRSTDSRLKRTSSGTESGGRVVVHVSPFAHCRG
jgi:hypothetical protein